MVAGVALTSGLLVGSTLEWEDGTTEKSPSEVGTWRDNYPLGYNGCAFTLGAYQLR